MEFPEKSQPLEFIKKFFSEMHEWETHFYPKIRTLLETDAAQSDVASMQDKARKTLTEIYDRFGITGKKNRNRIDGLSLSDPPTYENAPAVKEQVENDDHSVTFLVTKNIGPQGLYKYTLKRKSGQWILAKREFLDHEDKWHSFAF
jgi:hypothetical protein